MPITRKKRLSITIALICSGVAGSAQASGFRVPEGSIAGMGLANAMVANPNESGALVYNPAAMAFQPGKTLNTGIIMIDPTNEVTNTAGNTEANGKSRFWKPNFYYMDHINSQWSWGLNVGAPYGLETKWPQGTFPLYSNPSFPQPGTAGAEPKKSAIEMVNVNPNISFKVNPDTSVAFGVDYYYVNNVNLNTQAVVIEGDGDAWGWNFAVMHKTGPVTLGLSYRSSVDTDIDGSVSVPSAGLSGGASTSVEFPATLQLGIHYQVNTKLAVEFDYDRTDWSSFDTISVVHTNPAVPNPVNSANKWSDSDAFRFGVTYDLDSVNRLRFGYSYDKTPVSDVYFSARVPDADRQLFSIGYRRDMGGWELDAGYMYVKVDDRNINQPTFGGPDTASNGFANGNYESYVHLFGLGFSMTF
ncbi:MAG TPA: hypothetical protein ENI64_03645 [Gammaproteobacteria bacterium]|nr:hypothetical protein [Gammaproteobacteria bacterium]